MVLTYFIISSLLYALCESGCPSTCKCSELAVLCVSKDLESIPSFESLTVFPAILDLSGNKIGTIDNDDFTFDNSYAVKEVYLNNSEILDIESNAFIEMESLQELYLGENLLNSLPEDLIEELPNMILLEMSSNQFSGDMPKLRSESLEVLAIANSKVTNIPDDSIKYLPSLKVLLLQQNNIKHINAVVFEHVADKSFFVKLSYNVWECNCPTFELFAFLAKKEFIDTSEPYQCLQNHSEEFIDIYNDDGKKMYRNKCMPGLLKDGANSRKKHLASEPDKNDRNTDHSFSLVKENTTAENKTTIFLEKDKSNNKTRKLFEIKSREEIIIFQNCNSPDTLFEVFGIPFSLITFLIVISSFVTGIFIGYLTNILISRTLERKLETSDSRSKLLPTPY